MGLLYAVIGKSATGKDHIFQALLADEALQLGTVVPYTTRPMREGETEGVEYHFVTVPQMEALWEQGKIIERRCYQTVAGPWYYFTAEDGQVRSGEGASVVIATLEAYQALRDHYGRERVIPIYIEVEDGERLRRAMKREEKQERPDYRELCRRFLADSEDFSEERIAALEITRRYVNDDFDRCVAEIRQEILANRTDRS